MRAVKPMAYEMDWAAHRAMIGERLEHRQFGVLLHVAQMVVGALARFAPPTTAADLVDVGAGVRRLVDALRARASEDKRLAVARAYNEELHSIIGGAELYSIGEQMIGRRPFYDAFPTTVFHVMRLADQTDVAPEMAAVMRALHACEPLVEQLVRSEGRMDEVCSDELLAALPRERSGKGSAAPSVGEAWALLERTLVRT